MEKQKGEMKTLLKYFVLTFVVVAVAVFIVFNSDRVGGEKTPLERVLAVVEQGIDTSNSLYTEEEIQAKVEEFNQAVSEIQQLTTIGVVTVADLGKKAQDLRDYDLALALFDIADTMNPQDLFYRVEKGRIYLERQQWEQARYLFETMKITFPVHEVYLGLAQAYKNIEGNCMKRGIKRISNFATKSDHEKWALIDKELEALRRIKQNE